MGRIREETGDGREKVWTGRIRECTKVARPVRLNSSTAAELT